MARWETALNVAVMLLLPVTTNFPPVGFDRINDQVTSAPGGQSGERCEIVTKFECYAESLSAGRSGLGQRIDSHDAAFAGEPCKRKGSCLDIRNHHRGHHEIVHGVGLLFGFKIGAGETEITRDFLVKGVRLTRITLSDQQWYRERHTSAPSSFGVASLHGVPVPSPYPAPCCEPII